MEKGSLQSQLITSTGAYPGAHVAHAQGISAILISKFSPFDLLCDGKLFQVANPIPLEDLEVEISESPSLQHSPAIINKASQRFSVLCTPLFNQSSSTIDFIYARTTSLMRTAEHLLENNATLDQLYRLKLEAEQLKEAYNAWPETIPKEWIPRSVGIISTKDEEAM